MMLKQYSCDICHCMIAVNFHGEIDGVALEFYEAAAGYSSMRRTGNAATAATHCCTRCWCSIRNGAVEEAISNGLVKDNRHPPPPAA